MTEELRALSLWQPWASHVASGAKPIETRSWSTKYRGPVAIHAGKRIPRLNEADEAWGAMPNGTYEACRSEENPTRFPPGYQLVDPLPRGAVLCVARLVDVLPTVDYEGPAPNVTVAGRQAWAHRIPFPDPGTTEIPESVLRLGDFSPGRFAWLFEEIRPLSRPLPLRGRQGLWRLPADVAAEVFGRVGRN